MEHAYLDITFAKRLHQKMAEVIEEKRNHLESGTWETADKARHQVGYLKALRDVMVWSEDIAKEIAES